MEPENQKSGKLSRLIKKCSPRLYVDTLGEEIALMWRPVQTRFKSWIVIHNIPDVNDDAIIKAEYIKRLCSEYAYKTIHTIEQTDIPSNESKEIYFLFTFNESNFAYLIIQDPPKALSEYSGVEVDHINRMPLLLPIPGKYNFRLRFEGEQYSEQNGRKIGLNIKSYDDIQLTSSRRWPWQH